MRQRARVVLPLLKKSQNPPRAWPCDACQHGLPAERAVVLAALEGATPEDLAAYLHAIDELAAREAPAPALLLTSEERLRQRSRRGS